MDADVTAAVEGHGDTSADAAYRWTIRLLYVVAIGLNVWIMLDYVMDEPERAAFIDQGRTLWKRATRPFRIDAEVKRGFGRVLWEATEIVTDKEQP